MFWCCCLGRVHRHQLHLFSYGIVALFLILSGVVFTIFAVFQKESQIGKVWLSGPVLIVVGTVLCGKVMIDWGPAMERSYSDSLDQQIDELGYSNMLTSSVVAVNKSAGGNTSEIAQFKIPFKNSSFPNFGAIPISPDPNNPPSPSNLTEADALLFPQFDRINYGCEQIGWRQHNIMQSQIENKHEMTDKTTQAKMSCEKCAKLWSIIERKSKGLSSEGSLSKRQPKVLGKFVFSELSDEIEELQQE